MGNLLGKRQTSCSGCFALETAFSEPFSEHSLIGNNHIFLRLKVAEQWGKGAPGGEHEICDKISLDL